LRCWLAGSIQAQEDDTKKKFRAGLKFSMQPSWFKSSDVNTTKLKTGFGYGFGLNLDFRLSDVIYFSTGIGGDFESGKVKYRNDGFDPIFNSDEYAVAYMQDNSGAFVEAENDMTEETFFKEGNSMYIVTSRKIKTTHVTIPITLKMLTKEFAGFRYFGQFGGDLGIRVAAKAEDSYDYKFTYSTTGGGITASGTLGSQNIKKDCSLIPLRFGLNIGLGAEYRLAGSTSAFLSVNYFRSFTNLMRNDSRYMFTSITEDTSTDKLTFTHLRQGLFMSAIKINLGVMF
jgi:hypothetical protein